MSPTAYVARMPEPLDTVVVKKRTPNLIYRIDLDLKERLARQAAVERRTIKAVLEAALEAYLASPAAKAAPYSL